MKRIICCLLFCLIVPACSFGANVTSRWTMAQVDLGTGYANTNSTASAQAAAVSGRVSRVEGVTNNWNAVTNKANEASFVTVSNWGNHATNNYVATNKVNLSGSIYDNGTNLFYINSTGAVNQITSN